MSEDSLPYDIEVLLRVPGAIQVVDWYGRWPTFHDAFLADIVLSTWQPCMLRVHLSKGLGGPFIEDNEGIVTLYIEPPSAYQMEGTSPGGPLLGLTMYQHPNGCEILIEGDVINGKIITRAITRIEFSLWPPQYGR